VICAALWPDPADENCPVAFRQSSSEIITHFAQKAVTDQALAKHCSTETWNKWQGLAKPENQLDIDNPDHLNVLRYRLLDFIADFANWDNSTNSEYLETSRALTQAAHEALGGIEGTRPLVVDPFAGGGAIPLEALRVGADAFASDLNPVAVLLNKVVLEYIPKYGQKLADEVKKWGQWVKEEAEKELAEFYPPSPPSPLPKGEGCPSGRGEGETPIAYLWARTIISEAPDDGTGIPVKVPLMRSLWLAKKKNRNRALRWVRDEKGAVKTETVEVTYADGVTRKVRRPLLEIFEPKKAKEVEAGTVARGSATCPVTGFTTPVASVRKQLKPRFGGANDARLFCVVTTKSDAKGRFYRLPNEVDLEAVKKAGLELERRKKEHKGELSLVPDEPVPPNGRSFRLELYGITQYSDIFTNRQSLALTTLVRLVLQVGEKHTNDDSGLVSAVQSCLALAVDRQANTLTSLSRWNTTRENIEGVFGRQAIPMVWDIAEANSFSGSTGGLDGAINWVLNVCESNCVIEEVGQADQANAASHPLPDDSVQFFCSDPPYYDAIEYSDLSDFFYVWLKRTVPPSVGIPFKDKLTPKDEECIVNEARGKDKAYFEATMAKAMAEGCRILAPDGIGLIVFAHKSTSGWEAQLQAMVDAGWTITASWSIDTEMGNRLLAINSAALASSIHLVCRPRVSLPSQSIASQRKRDFDESLSSLAGRNRKIPPVLLERARELRKQQTSAEAILWECLRNRRLLEAKFRRQHNIGQIIADFYCHDCRLIIEVDGAIHQFRQQEDKNRDQWAKDNGFTVLRFTNEQVFQNLEEVLSAIAEVIISPPNPLSSKERGSKNTSYSSHHPSYSSNHPSPLGRGAGGEGNIGDWRDVLQELPQRIHEWLPRLAAEGVVGADAIFACLGPALEVFSRYSSVEKASGKQVTLKEYLEYVWAAVSKEALSMIFEDADATGFEEDARITAMWLWTLSTATSDDEPDTTSEEDDDESDSKSAKSSGFTLEFDAARKIAQGLGVHLENLSSLIEVKKDKARLLPVAERARQLLTKEKADPAKKTPKKKKKEKSQQLSLFEELGIKATEDSSTPQADIEIANVGKTVLDRIHQTMLLFAAGRGEGMKRFLVEEGIGSDPRFWKLAQALSALYPVGTDEKRWVDGVLARKKGLGF
jgi:adenine-specific DNA methylase/very-short-patch-repair endonuclease